MFQDLTTLQKTARTVSFLPSTHIAGTKTERIYAIDWLRVLAFGILMIYHTAEVFTTWNWWIKNDQTSTILSYTMMFFHEWRMFLLFIISGAATHLALGKRSAITFLKDRFIRILLPLIAGMILIIPPQIYFIELNKGNNIDFLNFYMQVFEFKWFPAGNFHWLHLWYMAYLLGFTCIMLPVIEALRSDRGKKLIEKTVNIISAPVLFFSLAFLMEIPYYLSKVFDSNADVQSLLFYFPYYVFGSVFLANTRIRKSMITLRNTALLLATITTIIFYLCFWIRDDNGNVLITLNLSTAGMNILNVLLSTANHWFWLICIIGFGLQYLTRGNEFLQYANKAVAPFYILHQTVIITIAYYMINLPYDISTKFYLILSTTFVGIFLLYHLVLSRSRFTQLLFGIKK